MLSFILYLGSLATCVGAQCFTGFPSAQNFQIYINTTGQYGSLGHPCRDANCGIFFTGTPGDAPTTYTLTKRANLVIVSETGDDQPANPVGRIAYAYLGKQRSTVVEFGRASYLKKNVASVRALECGISDSANGDGTCDLRCVRHLKPRGTSPAGMDTVNTNNFNQWFLGPEGDEKVTIKVQFVS